MNFLQHKGLLLPADIVTALRFKERVDYVFRKTTPILVHNDRKRPILLGSGVFLRIVDKPFLITAAHVLKDEGDFESVFYIPSGLPDPELMGLDSRRAIICSSEGKAREGDTIDLAIMQLSQETSDRLSTRNFASLEDIELQDMPAQRCVHRLCGFPSSRTKSRKDIRETYSEFFSIGLLTYKGERGDIEGRNIQDHLLLEFDRSDMVDPEDGKPHRAPDPYGMSGCGIWRYIVPESRHDSHLSSNPKLVAIATTWHKQKNAISGTRVGYVLYAIAEKFPELAGQIREAGVDV